MYPDKTILIVEDDEMIRDLLRSIIEDTLPEWQVLEAANGREGIVVAQTQRPDLILLDFHMPVMNGYETALILKEHEETCNIPLVLNSFADMTDPRIAPMRDICQGVLSELPKPRRSWASRATALNFSGAEVFTSTLISPNRRSPLRADFPNSQGIFTALVQS